MGDGYKGGVGWGEGLSYHLCIYFGYVWNIL